MTLRHHVLKRSVGISVEFVGKATGDFPYRNRSFIVASGGTLDANETSAVKNVANEEGFDGTTRRNVRTASWSLGIVGSVYISNVSLLEERSFTPFRITRRFSGPSWYDL